MAALTAPLPALRRAPSRVAATPRAQKDVAASVSQVPPPPLRRSSRGVRVGAPLPAWRLRRNVPSSAPSGAYVVGFAPTLSRSLPRNATPSVGAGGATVNPPCLIATWPSGFVTVTSRGPIVAVAPIEIEIDSCVDDVTVVEVTVTSAPNEALAPGWKFVPATVTANAAPGEPVLGGRVEIGGPGGACARGQARDRRHRRQGDGRGRRGAVGEVGGDREARAAGERRGIRVAGENVDRATVGGKDVHRAGAGGGARAV